MAIYEIEPTRETLHGTFSRDYPPVLTIEPGDTVVYRTLDASWGLDGPELPCPKFEPRNPEQDYGHALCGPIAIHGAEPGQMLEVQIKAIQTGTWGWSVGGGWDTPMNRRLGIVEGDMRFSWWLDPEAMTGRNQYGHQVDLAPFMGVMGVAPDEPGLLSTSPPRLQGGNIDCKELVAGSSLFLPIAVPGGLFSVGDGHAVQGDGEVSGVAIECPMQRVELAFYLHDTTPIATPHANTPAGWLTFGFDEDLNEATALALEAMINFMEATQNLPRNQAVSLSSLIVDMRITQIVNGVQGVHAVLPHGKLRISTP